MKKRWLIMLLVCTRSLAALAQNDSTHMLRHVIVFDVGTISQRDQTYFNLNQSISDNLDRTIPLNLKSYGSGMLTLSGFRGMSAEQTQIRWEGVPLNGAGTGLFDLSLFPAGLFGSAQLNTQTGPTLSGSGSGGVLNMYAPLWEKGNRYFISTSSLGNTFIQTNVNRQFKKWSFSAGFTAAWLPNRFRYADPFAAGHPRIWITNNESSIAGAQWVAEKWNKRKVRTKLVGLYTGQIRHIQPPMGVYYPFGKQADLGIRHTFSSERKTSHSERLLQWASVFDRLTYSGLADTNTALFHQLFGHYHYGNYVTDAIKLTSGLEYQLLTGWQHSYLKTHWESRLQPFALVRWNKGVLVVEAGWRGMLRNVALFRQAAHIKADYFIIKNDLNRLVVSANQSLSYRLPTLNEQFYVPGGNLKLNPEQGLNTELSAKWFSSFGLLSGVLHLQAYHILMENGIQWRPTTGTIWSPFNVKKYQSNGLSFNLELETNKSTGIQVKMNASCQIQQTKVLASDIPNDASIGKALIYQPPFMVRNTWQCIHKKNSLQLNLAYQSYRFIQYDNLAYLPGYTLIDGKINHRFTDKRSGQWLMSLECRNLLNTAYQVVQNYAMPGRSFNFSLLFEIP